MIYAHSALQPLIRSALDDALQQSLPQQPTKDAISKLLVEFIERFDASFISDLKALFPNGPESMLPDAVDAFINDSGERALTVHRAIRGTTALIALTDPKAENLWVASLGDCQAGRC